jgi:hypothetical protein
MTNLEELTEDLGEAYDAFKDAEKRFAGEDKKKKNRESGLKEAFFDAATEAVAQATLAQKTVTVPSGVEDPEYYALKRNPRWRVIEVVDLSQQPGFAGVVLEEDPQYKPFVYVNRKTKRVWTRSVRDGSPWLDDEELRESDPELWKRITRLYNDQFIRELLYHANIDPDEIDDHIAAIEEEFESERTLLPLENLDPDDLAGVQEYMYPGKPVVSLSAPRKAKPEELNEDDD